MTRAYAPKIESDTWVNAAWDEFVAIANAPDYPQGRAYFDQGRMRIEMASLGAGHARLNSVVDPIANGG